MIALTPMPTSSAWAQLPERLASTNPPRTTTASISLWL